MHKLCKILYFADQRHLSKYGRSITGDTYIAMHNGPVPSCVYDLFKALRGDSLFSNSQEVNDVKNLMVFQNRYSLNSLVAPDMDFLSLTDVECLDFSIEKCRDKSFAELTNLSHGQAWYITQRDRNISVKDILREVGDEEGYVEYIASQIRMQEAII